MRNLMLSGLLLAGGCFNSAGSGADGGDGGNDTAGGTIQLQSCGYSVTTRDGASAPVLGTAMLGSDPTPWAIHLGITGKAATSMNVVWRTNDDATLATQVRFGEGAAMDQMVTGFTFYYATPNRGPVRIHEAHLCGLKPDTLYSYSVGGVGSDGKGAWSQVYQFHTAPDLTQNPNAQVLIGVLGDTRGGYSQWGQALMQADMKGPPNVILFSGDAVTLGTLQSEWEEFFKQAQPVLSHIPLVGAHGNHDINSINYYSQFAFPGNEEYYGLDYGAAHITVVNDNPADTADLSGRDKQFLDSDLGASAAAPWHFAMHHMPLWSASVAHGSNLMLQTLWGPIFDAHHVDLVFNGHDHDYERTKPMLGSTPQATPAQGTVFIVSGSAGADLYDNGTGAWTQYSEKTRSLALIQVRKGQLDFKAYRDDGTALDSFSIMK